MRPPVTIVMTTWAPEGNVGELRVISAKESLASWTQHLLYDGEIHLHIADDGSTHDGYPQDFRPFFNTRFGEPTFSRQERRGVGASLNAGLRQAFERSPLAAYFVDDWALSYDVDLTPWIDLLLKDESIGMVRLGPPHPDLTGVVRHLPKIGGEWGLLLDRHHYAFGHRPAIYHQRFFEFYGYFAEGVNAFVCEQDFAQSFCKISGPEIMYALPYPWKHVGRAEVGDVIPDGA